MININSRDRIYKKPFKPSYMTELCRKLRKNPTSAEQALWKALREKDFFGFHFRRQAPFGRYIFDFYCAKMKFAIEIDGESHRGRESYDYKREEDCKSCGIKTVRFTNHDVLQNCEHVLQQIEHEIKIPQKGGG